MAVVQPGVWVTASFDNIAVSNAGSGDGVIAPGDWVAWATEWSGNEPPSNALDGDLSTRFTTGRAQHASQEFGVTWPGTRTVARIRMDRGASVGDEPTTCGIWVFDASDQSTFVDCVPDAHGIVDISFPAINAHYIEVWQWGVSGNWWSIAESTRTALAGQTKARGSVNNWKALFSRRRTSEDEARSVAYGLKQGELKIGNSWPLNATLGRLTL